MATSGPCIWNTRTWGISKCSQDKRDIKSLQHAQGQSLVLLIGGRARKTSKGRRIVCPFNAEEHQLYSALPLDGRAPRPISKAETSHRMSNWCRTLVSATSLFQSLPNFCHHRWVLEQRRTKKLMIQLPLHNSTLTQHPADNTLIRLFISCSNLPSLMNKMPEYLGLILDPEGAFHLLPVSTFTSLKRSICSIILCTGTWKKSRQTALF